MDGKKETRDQERERERERKLYLSSCQFKKEGLAGLCKPPRVGSQWARPAAAAANQQGRGMTGAVPTAAGDLSRGATAASSLSKAAIICSCTPPAGPGGA